MNAEPSSGHERLTGRIQAFPSHILDEEVLQPQFAYELHHFLPYYLQIEHALLAEYQRLDLLSPDLALDISRLLAQITHETVAADPQVNMSDISFAIERYVESRLPRRCPGWHVDRSRNDIQATAQVMFARSCLLDIVETLLAFSHAVHIQAEHTAELPMPGYTHYQAAQIITAGFYLAAINEQVGKTLQRLLALLDEINECPLGSGAMAGLELAWDRQRLARTLGFSRPTRHALLGVASKEWQLHIAAELSTCGVALSRFVTDLITWGSSEYRLIDLPDELSGISSAMPQKKNFPVLERIRGKTAHLSAYYLDAVLAQRNTPYTNLVETAKEGGSNFFTLIQTTKSLLKLFTIVMQHLEFRRERLLSLCTQEFFGGFTLANLLSLQAAMPYRQAQVLAGRYIVKMTQQERLPQECDFACLQQLCAEQGYVLPFDEEALRRAFSVEHNLRNKQTSGSTHPREVAALLSLQEQEYQERFARVAQLREQIKAVSGAS